MPRRRVQAAAMNVLFVITALVILLLMPEERVLIAPALALCAIALWFLTTLWVRDGVPPVFESGTMWMLATAVYGTVPMIGFALMHGQWTEFSDSRLQQYDFNRAELARFGWDYVIYTVSFVAVYLVARGRRPLRTRMLRRPSNASIVIILVMLIAIEAVAVALRVVYQYDLDVSYTQLQQVKESARQVPYVILQFSHVILDAKLVIQQAILALLFMSWRRWRYRAVLLLWLAAEVVSLVVKLGSRAPVVLLLLSAGMLYHRLVRPVTFRQFFAVGLILLVAFLGVGVVRVMQAAPDVAIPNVLTATNEFQALFTTAYDIHKQKEQNVLGDVPWQLYAVDLYLLIPRQLLPFQKIDPAQWYVDKIGVTGAVFMFGVMAEAALGLGVVELIARGLILGLLLGLLHRWYVKHAAGFWLTLLYLFVSIWTYYTFRATTFWFLYNVVYEFLPVMAFVKLTELLVSKVRHARNAAAQDGVSEGSRRRRALPDTAAVR
ncbi:MAG TPA: hypothetical protein VII75_11455 [Thermoanaerobaculia bacterium]